MKKEIKEKEYAHVIYKLAQLIQAYTELLRLSYTESLTTAHLTLADKIKAFLERWYGEVISDYLTMCGKGDPAKVKTILTAIGPEAFNEPWFIDGLRKLHEAGKEFKIPKMQKEVDFQKVFGEMLKFEQRWKRTNKSSALSHYDEKSDSIRVYHHRKLAADAEILFIHFLYGLLVPKWHNHIFDDSPAMSPNDLVEFLDYVQNILPE